MAELARRGPRRSKRRGSCPRLVHRADRRRPRRDGRRPHHRRPHQPPRRPGARLPDPQAAGPAAHGEHLIMVAALCVGFLLLVAAALRLVWSRAALLRARDAERLEAARLACRGRAHPRRPGGVRRAGPAHAAEQPLRHHAGPARQPVRARHDAGRGRRRGRDGSAGPRRAAAGLAPRDDRSAARQPHPRSLAQRDARCRPDRRRRRHHPPRAGRGDRPAGAEDGDDRPDDGRDRPRLQQPAAGDLRQSRDGRGQPGRRAASSRSSWTGSRPPASARRAARN